MIATAELAGISAIKRRPTGSVLYAAIRRRKERGTCAAITRAGVVRLMSLSRGGSSFLVDVCHGLPLTAAAIACGARLLIQFRRRVSLSNQELESHEGRPQQPPSHIQ